MQAVRIAMRSAVVALSCALFACATAGPEDLEDEGLGGFVPPSIPGGTGTAGAPGTATQPTFPRGGANTPTLPASGGAGGVVGAPGVGGSASTPGAGGVVDQGGGVAGAPAMGGVGGGAGVSGAGAGAVAGSGVAGTGGGGQVLTGGTCCASGDCLCHGPDPTALTSSNGPYDVDTFELGSGRVYYPTDAEAPFAAVAICAGFLNTGSEMLDWGTFYASHGIVTVVTWTIGSDIPAIRAIKLQVALDELQAEAAKAGNALNGKLTDRMGTSGYSMGGGGTTLAATENPKLRTSVGLAAWGPVGSGVTVPTLFLCGDADAVAPCFGSDSAYAAMPDTTPKMTLSISGATHFSWFGPTSAGRGTSGAVALAFQKVYLESDERWLPILKGVTGAVTTNIK